MLLKYQLSLLINPLVYISKLAFDARQVCRTLSITYNLPSNGTIHHGGDLFEIFKVWTNYCLEIEICNYYKYK